VALTTSTVAKIGAVSIKREPPVALGCTVHGLKAMVGLKWMIALWTEPKVKIV
jgi:hypothetical protein